MSERMPPEAQKEAVQVVLTPEAADEVRATASGAASPPAAARPGVRVAPNLLDVTTGRVETVEEKEQAREQHDLNEAVHAVLIVGLAISTALMLAGLVASAAAGQPLPTLEPDLGQVLRAVAELTPAGFMALGLLVLLATPILRVIGSVGAFLYERDWRFAGITFLVFLIVLSSILLGRG